MSSVNTDFQERGGANGRLTFAFKLWEVANDGRLIKWNCTGDGVIVTQDEYEECVQEMYPRFVQNSSFLNLKRLFRDYGFQRNVLRKKRPHGLIVEYSHPMFKKDNYDNIIHLTAKERVYKYTRKSGYPVYKARRKYTRRFPTHQSVFDSSSTDVKGYSSRFAAKGLICPQVKRGRSATCLQCPTPSSSYSRNNSNSFSCFPRKRGRPRKNTLLQLQQSTTPSSSANTSFSDIFEVVSPPHAHNYKYKLTDDDMFTLFQIFAKNELSEEMYVEAILQKFGHRFEHLTNGSFDELVYEVDETMNPGMSPFCYSEIAHEYSLEEM